MPSARKLIDRFGPLPEEVDHLMKIVFIKSLCRTANVEKLDAGPKGLVVSFRHKSFPDPAGLVGFNRPAGFAGEDQDRPERVLLARLADA